MLSFEEIDRYSRQILVPGWGAEGQEKVRAARISIRGTGEAAESAILYLAAAGIGQLTVEAFAEEARALNPLVDVSPGENGTVNVPISIDCSIGDRALSIAGDEDRAAVGAAAAVEALKAILGMPYLPRVSIPR